VKRGDIWTVAGGAGYAGKPRPAVIVQDDRFDTDSVTVCPCTTDPTDAPLFRLTIEPTETTGVHEPCRIMVDKITTVNRSELGRRIGMLDDTELVRLNRAIVTFLGIAGSN
jgi:mRNA interferase MazF